MEGIIEKARDLAFEAKSRAMAGQRMGGADTVEYVIVLVIAVVIGALLFAVVNGDIKTAIEGVGTKINTWFSSAV